MRTVRRPVMLYSVYTEYTGGDEVDINRLVLLEKMQLEFGFLGAFRKKIEQTSLVPIKARQGEELAFSLASPN